MHGWLLVLLLGEGDVEGWLLKGWLTIGIWVGVRNVARQGWRSCCSYELLGCLEVEQLIHGISPSFLGVIVPSVGLKDALLIVYELHL